MGQAYALHSARMGSAKNVAYTTNIDCSEVDGFICPSERCGRAFSEPIHLTDLSHRPKEEAYYACPFCFSRLNIEGIIENPERLETPPESEPRLGVEFPETISKQKKTASPHKEKNELSDCKHQFGYLKNRSKGADIPDDCLTCPKILNCMASS